jgi:hypothetical protein
LSSGWIGRFRGSIKGEGLYSIRVRRSVSAREADPGLLREVDDGRRVGKEKPGVCPPRRGGRDEKGGTRR